MRTASAVAWAGAGLAAGAVAAQLAPGLTASPRIGRFTPRLNGVGADRHVALTFDDGPVPRSTPAVLEALDALGWKATLFMLGEEARRAPGLAAEVAAAGHEVAVHGDRHRTPVKEPPWATLQRLRRAWETIAAATGSVPCWYRPPYGVLSGAALAGARRLGLRPVLWTALGRDWEETATPASIVANIAAGLRPGGTVLLHDYAGSGAWRATVAALPRLAELFDRLVVTPGPLRDHGLAPLGTV